LSKIQSYRYIIKIVNNNFWGMSSDLNHFEAEFIQVLKLIHIFIELFTFAREALHKEHFLYI